jgi:mannan endo-1,4-beta-mannosidase
MGGYPSLIFTKPENETTMQRPFLLLFLLIAGFRAFSQIDQKATRETKALYANLKRMQKQGVLFGHQDGLAYGLNRDSTRWMGEENRSDVKAVSGEFPAVIGWDLGKMEFDSARNLDGVPFELMKKRIVEHYQRGGINTVSWHPNNPIDPSKTTWDKVDSTLKRVLNDKSCRFLQKP